MKDNENQGMLFGAGLAIMAALIFAIMAFIAIILTVLALFAWNRPLRIGSLVVQPDEARSFVYRGLIGAVVLPAFIAFATALYGVAVDWDSYLFHILLLGYVGGSLGLEMLFADAQPPHAEGEIIHPPIERQITPPRPQQLPPPQSPPFRFASWDDDEEDPRG